MVRIGLLFPAWAGVILRYQAKTWICWTVPRMGGGDPVMQDKLVKMLGCSPHGRG